MRCRPLPTALPPQAWRGLFLFLAGALLLGCGVPGPPVPPRPQIPEPPTNLSAQQVGERVLLRWTLPARLTNGKPLPAVPQLEVHRAFLDQPRPAAELFAQQAQVAYVLPPQVIESFRHNNNVVVFPDALDARLLRERAGRYAVYGVKAVNKKGQDAGYSNLVATQLYPVAAPLARIATRVTERAIELRWQAPARTTSGTRLEAIAGYEIYRSETGEPGSFALHGTAPTGFYEDTQFRFGARYYYFIRTLAQFGADTVSSASSLTVEVSALDLFPPPSPTDLVAVGGPARVDLTWEASPAADRAGYYLYRSRAAGAGFERLNQRPVVGQSLADTGVEPGLTYYYVVTAVDADGNESEFSEEAAATPLPAE